MAKRPAPSPPHLQYWRWGTVAAIAIAGFTLAIAWPTQHQGQGPFEMGSTVTSKISAAPVLNAIKLPIQVFNPDLHHLRLTADGKSILAMGSDGIILRSTDDGKTWENVDTKTRAELIDSAVDSRSGSLTVVGSRGTILTLDAQASNLARIGVNTEKAFRKIAIAADGKQLAVGDSGIAYFSRDQGQSFQAEKTGSSQALTTVVPLPKRSRFVIGSEDGTILLRDEPGEWRSIATSSTEKFSALALLPDGALLAGTRDGWLLRSSDDGETWEHTQKNKSDVAILGFASNPNGSLWLARTPSPALYFSSSKGKKFQPLVPDPKQELVDLAWLPGRGFWGIASNGETYRSDWVGGAWIRESAPPLDHPLAIAVLPTTHTLLVVGRSGLIARSTDRGKQYQIIHPSLGHSLRAFADNSPAGCLVAVGLKATVLRSFDEGESWERATLYIDPMVDLNSVVVEPKTHALLVGGTRGTLLRSVDCARSFTSIPITPGDLELMLASEPAGIFALMNESAILRSQDGGLTFKPVTMQSKATLRQIVALSSSDLVAIGNKGRIVRSEDKGEHFQDVPSPTTANLHALAYSPVHRTLWAVGDHGTVMNSKDDGATWNLIAVPTEEDLRVVTLGPNGSKIWFGGKRGTVIFSANTGISYTALPTGSSQTTRVIMFDPLSKEFLIAVDDGTLYRSVENRLTQISQPFDSSFNIAQFYKPTSAFFLGGDRLIRIGAAQP